MKRIVITGLVLAAAMTAACKKKAADEGAGSGSMTAPPPPPAPMRPSQNPQTKLPPLEASTDPQNAAKVALGNTLFFDKRLSVDGTLACYSCHQNEDGTGGHDPLAIGPGNKQLTRHAPVMWNVGYLKGAFYWDGRSATLEDQGKAALAGGNMGLGEDKLQAKTDELLKVAGYKTLFKAAFGDAPITVDHVTQALAAYQRTIVCDQTPYDKFAAGDKTALTEGQQRGLDVFLGKGACNACHTPPHFSVALQVEGGVYWNAGIGVAGKDPAATEGPTAADLGRKKVTGKDADWAAFKVPSLRDIGKSPPYFHDGSMASLEDAVHYMSSGASGPTSPNLSPLFNDKALTKDETGDLVDFLRGGLACPGGLTPPASMP